MIKITLVVAVSFLPLPNAFAQTGRIDSLERKLTTTSEIGSFEILFELGREYFDIEGEKALAYARRARTLALLTQDSLNIVKSLRLIGQLQRRLNNLDSSCYFFKKCLPIAQRLHNYEETYFILNGISITLNYQAKYDESLNYNLKALDLAYSKKDSTRIDRSLLNLGLVYYKLMNYKMALNYYDKSLIIKTAIRETFDLGHLIVNISLCYAYLGEIDEARKRLKPLLEKCASSCSEDLITSIHYASGVIWYKADSLVNAEKDFLRSYCSAKKNSNTRFVFDNIVYLSDLYLKRNKLALAERFLIEGRFLARNSSFELEKIKLYEEFCSLYRTKGDYKQLAHYQGLYIHLKDSVYAEKHTNNLMRLHAELAEKENKARLASQEQLLSVKKEIITKQRSINMLIGLAVVLLILLIYILIRIFRDRKMAHTLLSKKVVERTADLQRNYHDLTLAIEQRNTSIAKMGKDLNTSIESMRMLCSAGVKTETDSNAIRYFDEIESTTLRLANSVNHILAESKVAS